MQSLLSDLGQKLLRCAESSLLDAPLDALGEHASDEEAAALLRAAFEAGEARSMRDFLTGDRLSRWAAETCTQREEEALCALLRSWLGLGAAGPDDPARLARLEPMPHEPRALERWAQRYGVAGELRRPACEVLAGLSSSPEVSLGDVCVGRGEQLATGRSLLQRANGQADARAYLAHEAAHVSSLEVREALWRSAAPAGPLRSLLERLRAVLAGTTPSALHDVRFVPARPVSIDLASGVCRAQLAGGEQGAPVRVKMFLSGFEHRALDVACDACARPRCVHARALAGRLVDACLDAGDRLHSVLDELVRVPSWKRFVGALSGGETHDDARERLCFCVRVEGEDVRIGVLVQTRARDGRWSVGKLVAPGKAARSPACREHDRHVLEALSFAARASTAQLVPADLGVLRSLVEHPHVLLDGSNEPVRITETMVDVRLRELPEGLLPEVSLSGAPVAAGPRARDASYLARFDRDLCVLSVAPLTPPLRRLLAALETFRGVLPPASYAALASSLASLRQVARVSSPRALLGTERPPPRKLLLRLVPGLDEGIDLSLTVRALPLAPLWSPGQGPELVHGLVDGAQVFTRRDLAWERDAAKQVIDALGLKEHLALEPFAYRVESRADSLEVLSRAARLDTLLDLEWAERSGALRLTTPIRAGSLSIGLFKRGQWLTVSGGVRHEGADIAIARLLDAARRGERFVEVRGQDYAEIEQSLFERLARAQLCVVELKGEPAISAAAAPFWLSQLGDESEPIDVASATWLAQLRENRAEPPRLDAALRGRLRDYQQVGAAWMLERSTWAPGVCLADEMGLGKTVQTIAVLLARRERGPALIVAPTSVVSNWCDELERFAPQLTVLPYGGASRTSVLERAAAGTVIVVSYELLLRDEARFAELELATQVVDEAQVVKNARTQRARAVSSLRAEFRIALTGTPVENRLGDLWSLFELIAPGLLGSWSRFRGGFAVPIERYENEERAVALRALVAPLVLRRTKDEVARELPQRTEVVHMVELSPAERDLYDAAMREAQRALGKRRRDDGQRSVQILAELTRLRQLACHPRLVLDDDRVESSKLHALVGLLDDILPRGHRVLLFSQFTRHLALVREALAERGITQLYLDGSTPAGERARLVKRFQAGEAQAFLISLKAGGTGLNLTAADYVVHLDPWWNPAAEDQASDRAHRMGQERPVTIVKLVAQGTIEEKVLGLHAHKRRLADAVLAGAGVSDELDLAALEALLSD